MPMSEGATALIVVGGRQYEKPYDPRCAACASSAMMHIDSFLAYGWSFARIQRYLKELGAPDLSPDELKRHVPHLAAPHYQARLDYEEGVASAGLDPAVAGPDVASLLRLTLQRAYERVTDGTAEVGPREVVALAKLKREIEREFAEGATQASAEQWQAAMVQLLWICRKYLGKNWAAFAADVRADETIAAATRGIFPEPAERREVTSASAPAPGPAAAAAAD
jgi:hypothetical protein